MRKPRVPSDGAGFGVARGKETLCETALRPCFDLALTLTGVRAAGGKSDIYGAHIARGIIGKDVHLIHRSVTGREGDALSPRPVYPFIA